MYYERTLGTVINRLPRPFCCNCYRSEASGENNTSYEIGGTRSESGVFRQSNDTFFC